MRQEKGWSIRGGGGGGGEGKNEERKGKRMIDFFLLSNTFSTLSFLYM